MVGTEQIDARLRLSGNIGGDIHAGVQQDGLVLFESAQTLTEVEEVGSARYLVSAPHHDFDRLGEDIDLTFEW